MIFKENDPTVATEVPIKQMIVKRNSQKEVGHIMFKALVAQNNMVPAICSILKEFDAPLHDLKPSIKTGCISNCTTNSELGFVFNILIYQLQ